VLIQVRSIYLLFYILLNSNFLEDTKFGKRKDAKEDEREWPYAKILDTNIRTAEVLVKWSNTWEDTVPSMLLGIANDLRVDEHNNRKFLVHWYPTWEPVENILS